MLIRGRVKIEWCYKEISVSMKIDRYPKVIPVLHQLTNCTSFWLRERRFAAIGLVTNVFFSNGAYVIVGPSITIISVQVDSKKLKFADLFLKIRSIPIFPNINQFAGILKMIGDFSKSI